MLICLALRPIPGTASEDSATATRGRSAISDRLVTANASFERGLTVSDVYGLWVNINDGVLASAKVISRDEALNRQLRNMRPATYTGKTLADVFRRVEEVRAKINTLRLRAGMDAAREFLPPSSELTPAAVYVISGHLLDGMGSWLIWHTGRSQRISPIYASHSISDKTPSHLMGMVDLADRRLDRLMTRAGH